MNLGQIRSAVGDMGYDSVGLATQINGFINDEYRHIYSSQRWPFLEKQNNTLLTSVGSNVVDYSAIADLAEFDAVRLAIPTDNSQFYNLQNIDPQTMRNKEHENHETAVPQYWSNIAQRIHLFPFPDQAYTLYIDYIYMPPALTLDTDVPVIPSEYHDILKWGATRLLALRERDIYTANMVDATLQTRTRQMEESYQLRQRQNSSTVKSSGYWSAGRSISPGRSGW